MYLRGFRSDILIRFLTKGEQVILYIAGMTFGLFVLFTFLLASTSRIERRLAEPPPKEGGN